MQMANPFDRPEFNLTSLSAAINELPNQYNRAGALNIFSEKRIATTTVEVEKKNGQIVLINQAERGAPGDGYRRGKRDVRTFSVPHFPLDAPVMPSEYQNVRAFGSTELETLASIVNDKLQGMKNSHDITHEHYRMGAIKGLIKAADGSTVYDLYSEFGITKKVITFNSGDDFGQRCREISRHVEDNLLGDSMTRIHTLVSPEFMDWFVAHASVKDAYKYHSEASQRLGGDPRKGFEFNGITFEEYRGQATDSAGNTSKFIEAGNGHAFPLGTFQTFQEVIAPADFNETTNTMGMRYYAHQEPRKHNRGIDLHSQSNVLALCNKPQVLVEVKKGT